MDAYNVRRFWFEAFYLLKVQSLCTIELSVEGQYGQIRTL
ncbi:hypothetical protein VCSRO200_3234 [Vibrio cholerae]|nr:hypothetical protein VCSRO200_3234 [Vibrio cholerae]GHZ22686.1 hypothetical protein VCSRO123_2658 [Vibrio cholerae]